MEETYFESFSAILKLEYETLNIESINIMITNIKDVPDYVMEKSFKNKLLTFVRKMLEIREMKDQEKIEMLKREIGRCIIGA